MLMFPLAALVSAAIDRKILRWIIAPLALLFIYFNVWVTWQYHKGHLLDSDSMTKRYFWRIVGRWMEPGRTVMLLEQTDLYEKNIQDPLVVYRDDFKNDTGAYYATSPDGKKYLLLNKNTQYSPTYSFAFNGNGKKWLRVTATMHCTQKQFAVWAMPQFVVRLLSKDKIVKENMIRVSRQLEEDNYSDISVDVELPGDPFDRVSVLFWNANSDKELDIYNLQATAFDR
jgi:hypothetical protein